jgi:hypothetical protein
MPVLSSLSGHEVNDIAQAALGPRRRPSKAEATGSNPLRRATSEQNDGGCDHIGRNTTTRTRFSGSAVIGRLRDIALGFHAGNPILESLIGWVSNAAFDSGVQAVEAAFRIG